MRTIMVPLCAVDLADAMAANRRWLDDHEVQLLLFGYHNIGDGKLVMKVDFAAKGDAEAFAATFSPHQPLDPAGTRQMPRSYVAADRLKRPVGAPIVGLDGDDSVDQYLGPRKPQISARGDPAEYQPLSLHLVKARPARRSRSRIEEPRQGWFPSRFGESPGPPRPMPLRRYFAPNQCVGSRRTLSHPLG